MSSNETHSPIQASTSSSNKAAKRAGKSKVITLHLSSDALSKFPSDVKPSDLSTPTDNDGNGTAATSNTVDGELASSFSAVASEGKAQNVKVNGNTDTDADVDADRTTTTDSPADADGNPSGNDNGNNTNSLLAPPAVDPLKRKGIPGPKPGMKRNASQLTVDGVPKPRGKPGPKKKVKVDGMNTVIGPNGMPKLGPKANQGAINAGLRALDRSGKPCRKWQSKGFQVKSFTGFQWSTSTWASQRRPTEEFPGDVKSDSSGSSEPAHKPNQDSSAVASEKSNSGGDGDTPMPTIVETASSPAPVPA